MHWFNLCVLCQLALSFFSPPLPLRTPTSTWPPIALHCIALHCTPSIILRSIGCYQCRVMHSYICWLIVGISCAWADNLQIISKLDPIHKLAFALQHICVQVLDKKSSKFEHNCFGSTICYVWFVLLCCVLVVGILESRTRGGLW